MSQNFKQNTYIYIHIQYTLINHKENNAYKMRRAIMIYLCVQFNISATKIRNRQQQKIILLFLFWQFDFI